MVVPSTMSASVSVIICTRNRADSLRQTLVSVGGCVVPADLRAELIVVDNGSTDGTAEVVHAAEMPNGLVPKYLLEKPPGLSHARNAALHGSTGEILLFTDDDVRVPPDWIGGMCKPIVSGVADAVAGGVHFPASYEPKLSQEPFRARRGWLASTESTDPHEPGCLVGANMAFSRHVTRTVGEFDPELGAGALGFCEESLFAYRLLDAGFRIRTAFEVSVEHHFDLARLTPATLLDMAARMGRSTAYVDYHWGHEDAGAVHTRARRAAVLLLVERLKKPWRLLTGGSVLPEAQRVQNAAYWRKLAALAGQPRHYQRASSRV